MKDEGCSNLPDWPHASRVYSHAYRIMEKHGADDELIEALNLGNENDIKAALLRMNEETLLKRLG